MIFTRRFGALAARPTFERIARQDDLDREVQDLLNVTDLEPASNQRATEAATPNTRRAAPSSAFVR